MLRGRVKEPVLLLFLTWPGSEALTICLLEEYMGISFCWLSTNGRTSSGLLDSVDVEVNGRSDSQKICFACQGITALFDLRFRQSSGVLVAGPVR